ncbi:MAG: DUF1080 domain-containing protein [Planctomycetes bacterium]|nr:DUF1080 domain-containing protein [Planctomycetota bacterium]
MIAPFLLALAQGAPVLTENDAYTVDYLRPPDGALVEVGGMDFLPDGRLAVSTRRGQVWLVENALAPDPKDARFTLFAEGLQEGLGLAVVDGHVVVVQRGELSMLFDRDKDGRAEEVRCITNGWGLSGNYHEFAYGLALDDQFHAYVSLNVGFWDPKWWHGKSKAAWRGWVVEVTPDGRVLPFASGFRSPCGLSMSPEKELWVTDNQGDWEPVGPVYQVKKGRFHGHPASLAWTDAYRATNTEPSDTVPPDVERESPALWLPYKWSRSAGNVVWDQTGGKFGPFGGQMFVTELTNGMVLRAALERVRGDWQGAVFLFRQRIGSTVRGLFAKDGTLLCGMTNRGWGGLSPSHGIARVRHTGRAPFEVRDVHLLQDGFELTFTRPWKRGFAPATTNAALTQYHYDWWWQYGSPERDTKALELAGVEPSADRTKLVLRVKELRAGEMVRCVLSGFVAEDGAPLLHDEFAYTLNQLPAGPLTKTKIARLVPPPAARETKDEGWLRLCYRDAFERWNQQGWRQCDVDLDLAAPEKLAIWDGKGALVNDGKDATDFTSKERFGDGVYAAKFFLPAGGEAQMFVAGRYGVRCAQPATVDGARANRCGAVIAPARTKLATPALDAWKGPGQWHEFEVTYRAARFDAAGQKTANARFDSVRVDETQVLADVEFTGPSEGAPLSSEPERARGPFVLRGIGTIALGGVRVRPERAEREPAATRAEGWTPLYDGEDLQGFTATGAAQWKVDEDGVLQGSGEHGVLWTARDDWTNFVLDARVKISEGGLAALWLRAEDADGKPAGYSAAINSSYPDPQYTGSFPGLASLGTQLVGADTWCDYRLECTDVADGVRLRAWINGVLFNDVVDHTRKASKGRIGLEQHHAGSVVELRSLAIRELPAAAR